jgi:putative SOS response-associated peptidase YedK
MCNAYTVRPRITAKDLDEISAAVSKLPSPLVRRLGRGVAVTQLGNELIPEIMRWGFPHPKYKSVNNARSESLQRGMWVEPMAERRCLVPISAFYEWQELPGRVKRPYEIRLPGQEWLWVAGLHGTDETGGPCYATITTEPPPKFAQIHDRLLAIVSLEEGLAFLRGEKSSFTPFDGPLEVTPCESPLKAKKPEPPPAAQDELF